MSLDVAFSLDIQGLSFDWPSGEPLCTNWSATLSPGLTLLVGGDGAGKSTHLRLLATACRPQAGQLVLSLLPAFERDVGGAVVAPSASVAQTSPSATFAVNAWPAPAAYRQYLFWCDPASDALDALMADQYADHHRQAQSQWSESAFDELLAELGLSGHLHKPLLGLSMGMRRKLRLACAMASGAPLTLMDDPLAALDHRSMAVVMDLLADCALSSQRVFVSTAYEPPDADLGAAVIAL
jgi:ABC-type multidrug transport system ATPase subunit